MQTENTNIIKLNVPYHSQFLEVEDHFWNIRSCGGACIKMISDYYKLNTPNILAIMQEAWNHGGYDPVNGFVHDFAVNYLNAKLKENNSQLVAKRKDIGRELTDESKINLLNEVKVLIENSNPVATSISKITLEQTKYHIILLVGFELDESGDIKSIIYHEPESTDAVRGAYRISDIDTFLKYWRGKIIYCTN